MKDTIIRIKTMLLNCILSQVRNSFQPPPPKKKSRRKERKKKMKEEEQRKEETGIKRIIYHVNIYNQSCLMFLLLCKSYFHGMCGCNFEALQRILGSCRLHFILKLHEGNVMASRYKSYFLETRESGKVKFKMNDISLLILTFPSFFS